MRIEDKTFTVRYIGIDTPETVAPNQPIEWLGLEATKANRNLVEGKTVYLERDVSETDRYGRLLRHVFVGDTLVSAELVRQGYAQISTYPPDLTYQSLFLKMQREARDAGHGLWNQALTTSLTSVPLLDDAKMNECDSSYPDVCIPSPPPDLNCRDISHTNFTVLQPDPHGFDRDKDGVGCES